MLEAELVLGRYRLGERIGAGGTATVSRAVDVTTGRKVAVKELHAQFARLAPLRRRFLREIEVTRALDHPGVIGAIDAGEDVPADAARPPRAFLILELVRGETLRQLLDRLGPLGETAALRIGAGLADILAHAHRHGVIHRDIKPENIFVTGGPYLRAGDLALDERLGIGLSDFGQARVTTLASLTGTSVAWGTPEYMAPEVFARGSLDPRSDLYGVGVVVYEALTGRLPWSRSEALARLGPAARGGTLPATGARPAVDAILTRLLSRVPAERPASAEEVARLLRNPAGEALAPLVRCRNCATPLERGLPNCLGCGQAVKQFGHVYNGPYRLVLRSLPNDPDVLGRLLDRIADVAHPDAKPLTFLTDNPNLYSKEEREAAIKLPAVLFDKLDEATADALERHFRDDGLDVQKRRGLKLDLKVGGAIPWMPLLALSFGTVGIFGTTIDGWHWTVAGLAAVWGGGLVWNGIYQAARLRRAKGRFILAGRPVAVREANTVLAEAAQAIGELRAPEARALLAEAIGSLHRLALGLARTPGLVPGTALERLPPLGRQIAELGKRLDAVDATLASASEAELMQGLTRLNRQNPTSPHAERARAESRVAIDKALAERTRLEAERDQLASNLCRLLAGLRDAVQEAERQVAPGTQSAELGAALADLEAFLSTPLAAPRKS